MSVKKAVLHAARLAGVFALMRVATRKWPRILCYHGGNIGDERQYNAKLFCDREQLRERLDWLRRKGFVASTLDEIVEGPAPARGIQVAVTLDDGWYSSYRDLLPLLAEFGYRPVLYLHTEAFLAGAPIASVTLRYILWKSGLEQARLEGFSPELDDDYVLRDPAARRRLVARAEQWLAHQPHDRIKASLERFAAALGVDAAALDLDSRRFGYMTGEELRRAAADGCRIELHGHVHQYEPGQPERNRANIERCREVILAEGLPLPVHYCYPSGAHDTAAPAVMAAAGVKTATTCLPGLVKRSDGEQRFFLPRFLDGGDVSMIEFEAEMSGVLELARMLTGRAVRWRPAPVAGAVSRPG